MDMTQKSLSFQELDISFDTIYHQMGYLDTCPSEHVAVKTEEMIHRMSEIVHPCFGYITSYATLHGQTLEVEEIALHIGNIIARQLEGSEGFAFFVATAGHEMDEIRNQLNKEGDTVGSFIADAIGSVVAERCADRMEAHLQQAISKLGWKHTNRFSPGYCQWDVSEQNLLFRLLGEAPCGVTLNEQCLMTPMKSVSGVIGIGSTVRHLDYSCGICDMQQCRLRKR